VAVTVVLSACGGSSSTSGKNTSSSTAGNQISGATDTSPSGSQSSGSTGTAVAGALVTLTGSVGDGPVTNARVTITDANGNVIASSNSNAFADYSIDVPAGTAFPVIIKATEGMDVVTGAAPTFEMLSVVTGPNETQANINPFSTLIVKTAQYLPGGLTDQNLQYATQYVLNALNAGLDTALVPNPISTTIGDGNVATMIKASEDLSEIIRRIRMTLQASNANLTDDDVISALAADLSDGVLDGGGIAGARHDMPVIAAITSGQVLIEAISNNLKVNGAVATAMLDNAIKVTSSSSSQTTADLPVTDNMLTQVELAIQTAQRVSNDSALVDLENSLSGVTAGMLPAQVAGIVSPDRSADLNNAIGLVATLTDQKLTLVNDSLRAVKGAVPPIVTLSASSAAINSGDSVTLTWSYTPNASCTTDGPVAWQAPSASGHVTVGPLTSGGTFTLTCTNSSGIPTSVASTITLNSPQNSGNVGATTPAPTPIIPPPVVTLSAAPSKINPGDSVTLTWSYTTGAACTATGPVTWNALSSSGQVSLGPLSTDGTFTLTCSNSGGVSTSAVGVAMNAPPTITAGPAAASSDIAEDETTQLSVTASDPDGDVLTYAWQPAIGTITGSGAVVTFNPPNVIMDTTVRINVTVTDPGGLSATGSVDVKVRNVATTVPANIGSLASVSASSQKTGAGALASNVVDGIVSGYPIDKTKEWETLGQGAGAWIRLDWSEPYMLDKMVLHDRINLDDQVLSGTLLFSDGTVEAVGALPNDGTGLTVTFNPREVTWVAFSVDSVSNATVNIGLAELEVYGSAANTGGGGSTGGSTTTVAYAPPKSVIFPQQLSVTGDAASSYDVPQNLVPGNALDGNSQTSWSVLSMPQWIVLDLGRQQVLSSIKMLIDGAQGGANFSYTIATSLDNQAWTQAFNGNSISISPQWTEAVFTPVYARYVRINLSSSTMTDYANIYEIVPNGLDMTASGGTPTNASITVSWNPNADAVDGYILYFGENAATVNTEATVVTNSDAGFNPAVPSIRYDTWYDLGLAPGDGICFKVRAYNANGVSNLTSAVCGTI